VGAAAALLVLVFIGYCVVTLPAPGNRNADETGPAIVFAAADGQVFAARGAAKGEKVAIDRLPADLVHAVIAIEDRRFYSHHGIDLRGILRAAWCG
jgi:penicillin-binding protein 1A